MSRKKYYTMDDRKRDKTLKVEIGQIITPDVYYQLLGAMPPHRNDDLFQAGEPHTHDLRNGKALYKTFKCKGCDYYEYIGLMY